MTTTIYGVCKGCGKVVSKEVNPGNTDVDETNYRSVESKYCSCKEETKRIDITRG